MNSQLIIKNFSSIYLSSFFILCTNVLRYPKQTFMFTFSSKLILLLFTHNENKKNIYANRSLVNKKTHWNCANTKKLMEFKSVLFRVYKRLKNINVLELGISSFEFFNYSNYSLIFQLFRNFTWTSITCNFFFQRFKFLSEVNIELRNKFKIEYLSWSEFSDSNWVI